MKTELLSPAGTLKNMRYAFAYGADAVYAGQPRYSLRVRNNDFGLEQLNTGIQEALCNLKMTVMWSHNDDTFNAVITCGHCVSHCWLSAVAPLTVHRQFVCRLTRFIVVA